LSVIARYFHLKNEEALFASLGRGNIRIGQILQSLQPKADDKTSSPPAFSPQKTPLTNSAAILDADDVLTRFALCCKPIPGDEIIGYITQGRGISIHKKNCNNVSTRVNSERLMTLTWNKQPTGRFSTDLKIIAQDKDGMLNDLTALLANEKISLLSLHTTFNRSQNRIVISISIYIEDSEQLSALLHRIQQLPGVIEVNRTKSA
jgi:GTP pyrophosphokinase